MRKRSFFVTFATPANGSPFRPGMMDTILNLGLNDKTVAAVAKATKNERFAWDCYRRFIQMYGDVVMGVQNAPTKIMSRSRLVIARAQTRAPSRGCRRYQTERGRPERVGRAFQKAGEGPTGKQFPNDPWNISTDRSAPCSARG